MERKLLSLPSFFVLLLVAGIAFLAAPVVDVHAAAPTVASAELINPTGSAPAPDSAEDAITTAGKADVVVIKLTAANPPEVTSAGPPAVTAANGFGAEDIIVTVTNSVEGADPPSPYRLHSSKISIRALEDDDTVPGESTASPTVDNVWFVVNVDVPDNGTGTMIVQVAASGANGSSFREAASPNAVYSNTANLPAAGATNTVHYNTHNPAPTVTVNWTAGAATDRTPMSNAAPFEVTFAIADTADFSTVPTFVAANIAVVGGMVNSVGPVTQGADKKAYSANAFITPDDDADHVVVGVKADVVTDAGGAKNVAVPTTLDDDGAVDDAKALKVTVDTDVPMVKITPALTLPDTTKGVSKDNVVTSIAVTFEIQEGTPLATIQRAALVGEEGDELEQGSSASDQDITVTGGTLSDFQLKPAQYQAIYTATITPAATAEDVVITVKADAVKDRAGNGSPQATMTVDTGYEPGDASGDGTQDTGIGAALTGSDRGFSFTFDSDNPAPTATNRFVVLAKSGAESDNGLTGTNVIDIKDEAWEDLADFLAYDGGTIDLIGPTGTVKNTLIINEIMWGGDAYLSDPTRSQWIELYNATTTRGTATGSIANGPWKIQFHAGITPRTAASTLSDSFSNRELGNAHWDIPNVSGGKYGQSGRTKLTPGTAGSLRDLVSMRRKTDYDKVEKNDHKAAGAANDQANRDEQVKGIPDGALAGSWEASTSRVNMSGTRKGTPGARHVVVVGTTGISKSVVFNEIANRSDKKFDWIELYNPGSADVKINNWVLSKVTAVDKDDKLFKFESDENIVVPAKGFLLVVNEDPSETALAAGANVNNPNSKANNLPTKVYVNSGLDIPEKDYLLILRTEEKLKSHEKIVDIGGHLGALDLTHANSATELWPLKAWKRIKDDDLGQNNDKTWVRDKGKDLYHADAWKSDGGVTGLGIDRNPDSDHGPTSGTPGFDNGAIKDKVKDLTASDPVVISEIMFGTGSSGRRVPQWIELFNPSTTQAVKLNAWRLEVRNTNDASESLNVELSYTLILPDVRVLPKQTVLIVSSSIGEATRNRFPSDRIINLWSNRSFRDITEATSPRDPVLSSVGFYMKLSDPDKKVVDEVGNIDGTRRSDDTPAWTLPGGNLEEGGRASIIRREGTFGNGTEKDAWISAAATDFAGKVGIKELYYGDEDDIGTPGYRTGGPLPVQLSSFYSKRNDAGAVVITWSTESELDNAGFNILRSLSRVGEFTRINAQLIPGAGTTGEKNTYTWTDTSARPNVVYYYQIEDVSLDGEHRTLRTTRLRGYVGAAGKATTIWGELKSRD